MSEKRKEVRSNRLKKVRGDRVRRAGGQVVRRWEVTRVRTSLAKSGEKEVRVGDEEVDVGQVVSAGG